MKALSRVGSFLMALVLCLACFAMPADADALDEGEWFICDYYVVNSSGVYGYDYNYVFGGDKIVQKALQKGDVVYAHVGYSAMGLTWASCGNTEVHESNFVYYGWVDMQFLSPLGTDLDEPEPEPETEPAVVETDPPTEAPTEAPTTVQTTTVATTTTILTTTLQTTSKTTETTVLTTAETTTEAQTEPIAIQSNNNNNNSSQMNTLLIVLVGAVVVLAAGSSALTICLLRRNNNSNGVGAANAVFCPHCGESITEDAVFCKKCGQEVHKKE